ncbi:MAG: hypothetical protein Q8J64_06105 [Thermodesulfovibrionales bacterium]|nr:hypothetical protein [Thermodesulfovibrionales bacterium]
MIDKQEFYHGAAIVRLLEYQDFKTIKKYDNGYLINEEAYIFFKYTTKNRSPWRFTLSQAEIERLNAVAEIYKKSIIALICAGDGICAISWKDGNDILGDSAGWISARRNFNKYYSVAGSIGVLKRKVSSQQWPSIIFNPVFILE